MDTSTFYRIEEGEFVGQKYKPGTCFHYKIGIPQVSGECALLIEHDCYNEGEASALARLYEEKIAPPCVQIGLTSGNLSFENGQKRNMRLDNYDLFNSEYGDFLVYELIPSLTEKYGLNLSPNPDYHMVGGGSSGGISAWMIAWYHTDYFRRIYISSPSFLAMCRGNEIPYLMRKYETKPFKVYEEYSEDEPNDYFGSSYCVALEAKMSLEFAGYDFKCKYFPGEGHCSRYFDADEAYVRMKHMWEGYSEHPITAPRNSARLDEVIPFGSKWEKTDSFTKKEPTREVFSADYNMLYCGDESLDELWKYPVNSDRKTEEKRYVHGYLHTLPGFYPKGAVDMEVDSFDRLYVLTSMGIQCVRSFGLIDAILSLPVGEKPEMIKIVGKELYLKTDSAVWKREICTEGRKAEPTTAHYISYYDN